MSLSDINNLLAAIMGVMTESPQYEDFEEEFTCIENIMSSLGSSHPSATTYETLMMEMYKVKGNLEDVHSELESFHRSIIAAS